VRRSVDAVPSSSLSYYMLAQAYFFRREFEAFRNAAERAIALNPMDACTVAFMGILLAYTGEWERGCALTRRAMELNPNHPGWYRFAEFSDAYRKKDYRGALDVAVRFSMPSYYFTPCGAGRGGRPARRSRHGAPSFTRIARAESGVRDERAGGFRQVV
jgi:adenylate cyclase